jgi:hypothetical protein
MQQHAAASDRAAGRRTPQVVDRRLNAARRPMDADTKSELDLSEHYDKGTKRLDLSQQTDTTEGALVAELPRIPTLFPDASSIFLPRSLATQQRRARRLVAALSAQLESGGTAPLTVKLHLRCTEPTHRVALGVIPASVAGPDCQEWISQDSGTKHLANGGVLYTVNDQGRWSGPGETSMVVGGHTYTRIFHRAADADDPSHAPPGTYDLPIDAIQALATRSSSIIIRQASCPKQSVTLVPGVTWPLEKLSRGEPFDLTLDGEDISRDIAAQTWAGPCLKSMWNSGRSARGVGSLEESLYQACSNARGLRLSLHAESEAEGEPNLEPVVLQEIRGPPQPTMLKAQGSQVARKDVVVVRNAEQNTGYTVLRDVLTVSEIGRSSVAYQNGLRSGCRITHVDGAAVSTWEDYTHEAKPKGTFSVTVSVPNSVTFDRFETVGAPHAAVTAGKVYYEVELRRVGGNPQFGWCSRAFNTSIHEYSGSGVGDDDTGWGVDGARRQRWHAGDARWGGSWNDGDTIGFAADLGTGNLFFSVNGSWEAPNGLAFEGVQPEGGIYPALTASSPTAVVCNFGDKPWKFSPPDDSYLSISEALAGSQHSNRVNYTSKFSHARGNFS